MDPNQRHTPDATEPASSQGLRRDSTPVLTLAPSTASRPSLRGVNHLVLFPIALAGMVTLTMWAKGERGELAALVFGGSICLVIGMSALYHRVSWPAGWARWARRLDHSMIFVAMAGIYTSTWLTVLHGPIADTLLVVAWAGAVAGVALKMLWIDAPRALASATYNAFGLTGLLVVPGLWQSIGAFPTSLLLVAGLAFILGGVVYTFERPNPLPDHFGFHEVFHLLTSVGIVIFYTVMALWIIPH